VRYLTVNSGLYFRKATAPEPTLPAPGGATRSSPVLVVRLGDVAAGDIAQRSLQQQRLRRACAALTCSRQNCPPQV